MRDPQGDRRRSTGSRRPSGKNRFALLSALFQQYKIPILFMAGIVTLILLLAIFRGG